MSYPGTPVQRIKWRCQHAALSHAAVLYGIMQSSVSRVGEIHNASHGDIKLPPALHPEYTPKPQKRTFIPSPGFGFAKVLLWLEKISDYHSAVYHRVVPVKCSLCPEIGHFPGLFMNSFLSISLITACKRSARGTLSKWCSELQSQESL